MWNIRKLMLVGACLAGITVGFPASSDQAIAQSRTQQLIIRLDSPAGQRQAQSTGGSGSTVDLSLPDGRPVRVLRSYADDGLVVELPEEVSLAEAREMAASMASRAGVVSVQPDKRYFPALVPNDPAYPAGANPVNDPGQWHLFETTAGIRMPTAWDLATGSASVVVAVIDTGIIAHRDLNGGRVLTGYDFFSNVANDNDGVPGRDNDPTDPGDAVSAGFCGAGEPAENSSWHGLSVAGVIFATSDNSLDIAGMDFAASLLPIRVLGRCGGSLSDVADAIKWAAGLPVAGAPPNMNPADVINLSLSGEGQCSLAEQDAIDAAVGAGAVVVVAAGNDDGQNVADVSPANCDNVIVAGAIARSGSIASYSDVGLAVDLTAPGGDNTVPPGGILTLFNTGTTTPGADALAAVQGTSFTAAQVSGVASLMISLNNALTPAVIEDVIKATTRVFPDTSCNEALCGTGVLHATAALTAATNTAPIEADQRPLAAPGGPYSGSSSSPVMLDGSGSTDPEGQPLSYAWDFGDGTFGTGVSPSHDYGVAGTFTAVLVVNDGVKDSLPSTTTVTIDGGQKTANTSGGGGCSLGAQAKPDPSWWLVLLVSVGGLLLRIKSRGQAA